MATRCVVVGSKVGLHARPAALLVQAANRLPMKVTIAKEGMNPSGRAASLWCSGWRSVGARRSFSAPMATVPSWR
jgi:hypothetical protein